MKLSVVASVLAAASLCTAEVLVSLPVNIDGSLKNLQLLRGESVERAALSFMEMNGLVADGVESQRSQEYIAQLASMLREKVAEQQPVPSKEIVVTIPLTINGVDTALTLFREEPHNDAVSRFLRDAPLTEDDKVQVAPQLLQLLQTKVAELNAPTEEPQFSFTITIDGQPSVVQHFEGSDPLVEARAFAARLGITNENFLARLLPQVASEIQKRIDEIHPPPPTMTEHFSVPLTVNNQAVVLLSLPITIGDQVHPLDYYEGDSPDLTAQLFLEAHGLTNNPNYAAFVQDLSLSIRRGLQDLQQQQAASTSPKEPLFQLPITLGQKTYDLSYYDQENPGAVANEFCTSKIHDLSTSLGRAVTDEELQQCKVYIYQTITRVVDELAASTASESVQQPAAVVEAPVQKRHLFTLDIDLGEGKNAGLPYHEGDDAAAVATQFCERNNVELENVPMLVEAIHKQVAKL
ncbi:hypothetical protein H310_06240 [Aphanomyces invadans]|uniref:PFU domain-containing protein n=1 Tax=Aphanomyces invadans TaxID=157072 RepID=A0A024U5U9_9STRA|nr:hypothetical protein H310_06240 [Aphanomyces invadans]ETW01600.1 hypothetical protein H310_06240 [Aphanomyces invadans]|eukprot:XP_008869448.1 hypothetical protein H310_06240 [Aphanomyces invadans]